MNSWQETLKYVFEEEDLSTNTCEIEQRLTDAQISSAFEEDFEENPDTLGYEFCSDEEQKGVLSTIESDNFLSPIIPLEDPLEPIKEKKSRGRPKKVKHLNS